MVALLFWTLNTYAAQILETKTLFSVDVPTPNHLVLCQQRIWAYSSSSRSWTVIAPNDGRIVARFDLNRAGPFANVAAASCFHEKLIVGLTEPARAKMHKNRLVGLEISADLTLEPVFQHSLEIDGRITDLTCSENRCLAAVAGEIYSSENLKFWKRLKFPKTGDILPQEISTEGNLFADWQEKLETFPGGYTQVGLLPKGRLVLLDPFRSAVVFPDLPKPRRWGRWGVWEGNLYTPKSIAVDLPFNLYIADPALKAVFSFGFDGTYRGALGKGKQLLKLDYPISMLESDQILWVADHFANRVYGFSVGPRKPLKRPRADEHQVRVNFFRRPEVLDNETRRCLLCHDGAVHDATLMYVPSAVNHPTRLGGSHPVNCSSCHDPHHKTPTHKGSELLKTCLECHKTFLDRRHGPRGHGSKSMDCMSCHKMHGGSGTLWLEDVPALCNECHKIQSPDHRSPIDVAATERARNIHLHRGKISCLTCHEIHDGDAAKLLRPRDSVLLFCASCHGPKAQRLYDRFHHSPPKATSKGTSKK